MAENRKIVRIWFYPLDKEQYFGSKDKEVCKAVLSRDHCDILFNDTLVNGNVSDCKKKLDEIIKVQNVEFLFLFHKSTKIVEIEKWFNGITEKEHFFHKNIVYLENGNAKNDENYAALESAIDLYKNAETAKNCQIITNCDEIKFDDTSNEYEPAALSTLENRDKWEDFLPKLKDDSGNFIIKDYTLWAYTRNFAKYKLHKLETKADVETLKTFAVPNIKSLTDNAKKQNPVLKEFSVFDNFFNNTTNGEENKNQKLNIILAPGDLTKKKYKDSLIHAIKERELFGIQKKLDKKNNKETWDVAYQNSLIIICNKAGKDHLLNNSSIWYRCIELDNLGNGKFSTKFDKIVKEINDNNVRYKNVNAKENLDFHLRQQAENHLTKFGDGHMDIIPKIYTSEAKCKEDILKINGDSNSLSHPEIALYNQAHFRILLIDDKTDKAELVSKLMKPEGIDNEKLIWDTSKIETHQYNKLEDSIKWAFKNKDNTQILQVTNIADAIRLLACEVIKFDLILMDYLLGDNQGKGGRELATDFFRWMKDENDTDKELKWLYSKLKDNNEKINSKYYRERVKANRGPLKKVWIFPITAFNQTLKDDLSSHNVRFIDYYWHISSGADPVNNPYLFLRNLNNFLYLQLEHAVYDVSQIGKFIRKNIDIMKASKNQNDNIPFKEFVALMGADYSVFVEHFVTRPMMYRDRNVSLFCAYIWTEFMKNDTNNKLFLLTQYVQKFYHRCAFGSQSEINKMKLFWRDVKVVLDQVALEGTEYSEMDVILDSIALD